ncbi:uncharacterized protein PV09_02374 [Verruconis gallopava]|uniref:CFEM domain-containing protein n=1 Tax=Verruconis gallopava TaxID=253628 RepID=A0A0D2AIG0_9PEZI|nr:uncharacterized protein PV09_02374 [Verruconis gallopava]KIW06668.1 hypothetical protein PV09_02374 [Verruconis gallopava]
MRFSTFSAITTLAAAVFAQDLSQLPSCGYSCISVGVSGSGCSTTDIACLCKSSSWISELACCVSKSCDAADQQSIASIAEGYCSSAGVTTTLQATCASSATSAATNTAASVTATASSAASSLNSVVNSVVSSVSSAASTAATATTNAAPAPTRALGMGMGVAAAAAGLFAAAL